MKIVLSAGGSGGHITPILAVARELRRLRPDIELIYIGQRGDLLSDIPAQEPAIDRVYTVRAGKFRRYHGSKLRQLLDIPTVVKNLRDAVWVVVGIVQSWLLLGKLRPNLIFTRGGFVSVPVALAGALRGIPYLTHDSDPIPSLANRIIAPWATLHAVALPAEVYPYPAAKTLTVGIPLSAEYQPLTSVLQARYRREIGIAKQAPLVLITGGGNGAQRLNLWTAEVLPELFRRFPDLHVVHSVGRSNLQDMEAQYQNNLSPDQRGRVLVKDYLPDLWRYSGAADVVVARAGATNLAELALQGKACIVVPNPELTGGHQVKNAKILADKRAIVLVEEAELKTRPSLLGDKLADLLQNAPARQKLAAALATFAIGDAATRLAVVLLEQAAKR